ncbi:CoA-binding protein [Clostridium thermarum]|uniref:CoA-binding protein n=1 Tax=Clostridium thermarum TaxID=1716543 RepID=UPI0013D4F496|nr:CoA-binding protein [Clostridium thermarum]
MNASEFMKFKDWAVAGDVLNNQKYAYKIKMSLEDAGFNVSGIKPGVSAKGVYQSLKEVPHPIDVLDLCINPRDGIKVVKEAKELGIDKILIQPGAESTEILEYCKENGINAIEGCALVELTKIF